MPSKLDLSTLKSLFQMMSPSDLFGGVQNALGKQAANPAEAILQSLLDQPGSGVLTARDMKAALESAVTAPGDQSTVSEDNTKMLHKAVRFYSSEQHLTAGGIDWFTKATSQAGQLEDVSSMDSIIGAKEVKLVERDKKMSVILSTSNFVTPAVRKTGNAEIFLNFLPAHIASRCVPYLSVEMMFDRPTLVGGKLNAPGLLKFLLGATDTTGDKSFSEGTANALMVNASRIKKNDPGATEVTVAGMEMFTSPQTLVNMDPASPGSRYAPVLDPFRPLASVENLTINVAPTVGTYSYKKATLALKLHDRSRLSEVADLIKPQVYTKTTIWLTYGWRHPPERGNPYADFVNDNMLVREAYGISNASYTFDRVGQVSLNLELYTKGVKELQDLRITGLSESFEDIKRQMTELAEEISARALQLGLAQMSGLNKEIRAFQVLEAGERGEFPDLKPAEVQQALVSLRKSLGALNSRPDQAARDSLLEALNKLYDTSTDSKKQLQFSFKERLDNVVSETVSKLFKELELGPDPYLMTQAKDELRLQQLSLDKPHPFVKLAESYNAARKNEQPSGEAPKFRKRLVSVGKIISVFLGRGIMCIPGVDEVQLFFYNFNDRAGRASGQNIAEFPIDLSVFYEQFRDYVSRNRSDNITLEEFLKLVISAQLGDVRGVGYGMSSFFQPFDPKAPEPKLKKNSDAEESFQNAYAGAINERGGAFNIPTIEVYVESSFAAKSGAKVDLLSSFEQLAKLDFGRRADTYTRVMRVHIFDRQINPHPLATSLLSSDIKGVTADFARKELLSEQFVAALDKGLDALPPDIKDKLRKDADQNILIDGLTNNEKIKRYVSKFVPSILYGTEGSCVTNMNVTTKQDALLSAAQMIGAKGGKPSAVAPNGGGVGGLPLQVIPAAISIECLGCPLLDYMQLWFIDMNTGTSIDNVYGVTGLTHVITPGRFQTTANLTWYDAYGRFTSQDSVLKRVQKLLSDMTQ